MAWFPWTVVWPCCMHKTIPGRSDTTLYDFRLHSSVSGDAYLKTQCSVNSMATSHDVISRIGKTCVRLLEWYEMKRMKTYPSLLFGRGPRMSAATDYRSLVSGNNCNYSAFFYIRRARLFAQQVHWITVASTYTDMCGQRKELMGLLCMRVLSR